MNILITGAKGQLGREIHRQQILLQPDTAFYFTDQEELDITSQQELAKFADENPIDTIINCAAYTDVDAAESNPEQAYLINDTAVGNLTRLALEKTIRLIHISTDYVFDGIQHKPYRETDTPRPRGIYGKSKLAGEQRIIDNKAGMIIRTSWLYSPHGKNFVNTISRLVREKEELKVVYDQIGSPTHAGDLAHAILEILNYSGEKDLPKDIYHFANEGVCSWYDFAQEIARLRESSCSIRPIESKDWPTPAPRPHYSVFNKQKIKDHFSIHIPYWRDSLAQMLHEDQNL